MRTERNDDGTYNVWMTREEYREIPRQAHTTERTIAIRLMGDCGLRAFEVPDVAYSHISRMSDGEHFKLEVVSGKDTTGKSDGGKHRETWMPDDLERLIFRYKTEQLEGDGAQLIDKSKRAIQNWVKVAASDAAEATGDSDYERVSSHDLRRCWANHLLVEEGVSPRIVMALGGWGSYKAIEPYLAAPTERNITESMAKVEL